MCVYIKNYLIGYRVLNVPFVRSGLKIGLIGVKVVISGLFSFFGSFTGSWGYDSGKCGVC